MGHVQQPQKVGAQEIVVVAQQLIDKPSAGGVGGQRAQQVRGRSCPADGSPIGEQRPGDGRLVGGYASDRAPAGEEGLVERLVDSRKTGPSGPSACSIRKLAAEERAKASTSSSVGEMPDSASITIAHRRELRPGASAKASAIRASS